MHKYICINLELLLNLQIFCRHILLKMTDTDLELSF